MGRRALALGEHGEVVSTPQRRVDGMWRKAPSVKQAERWRVRCKYRGNDGVVVDLARFGRTKREAERGLLEALDELGRDGDGMLTAATPLAAAGKFWLAQIERPEADYAPRTLDDYRKCWDRHIIAPGSTVRGLNLQQVNDPQRLRGFLQSVADSRGTGSAKIARSVLNGVLSLAVDSGVLPGNALRQVRVVKASTPRESQRDLRRAFTRAERDAVVAYADKLAHDESATVNPRSRRKRETTADMVALMAGTGVRIDEARSLRWDHVDLALGHIEIHGTKTRTSRRRVNVPAWLAVRLTDRAGHVGQMGLVFPAPGLADDPEQKWEQSNSNAAVRSVLDGAGMTWAVPHTFRRTVATMLSDAGVPIARIADQLGHADPAMTASVYLGRDFDGDKADLAAHL